MLKELHSYSFILGLSISTKVLFLLGEEMGGEPKGLDGFLIILGEKSLEDHHRCCFTSLKVEEPREPPI